MYITYLRVIKASVVSTIAEIKMGKVQRDYGGEVTGLNTAPLT
jgi:hypothetical protein